MAAKNSPQLKERPKPDSVYTKWVKKAGMYCKTTIKDGKQTQEWITA